MMGSLARLVIGTRSSSLIGIGGGSSPFMGAELTLLEGDDPASVFGVKGDLGVLSPEWEVRGDIGGLSLLGSPFLVAPWVGVCLDFDPSGMVPMDIGEMALSEFEPPEVVAPRLSRRVQVKMSRLISV